VAGLVCARLAPDGTGQPSDPSNAGYLTRGPMGSGTKGRARLGQGGGAILQCQIFSVRIVVLHTSSNHMNPGRFCLDTIRLFVPKSGFELVWLV
jgi:hypothetical protein